MMNSALALTMLFAAGTAVAAPATPSRESALSSIGRSMRLGVADYKERRAAAGPGFFKRTMVKTGATIHAAAQSIHGKAHEMHLSFKAHVASTKANLVDKGETVALKAMIATDDAKANIKGAGETMALEAMYAGDKVKDVGETVALRTMIAADNVKAFGNKVVSNTKARFETAKGQVVAAKDRVIAAHEKRVAYKAADRDFQAWLKEPGNEDAATFYKGAAKDAHITRTTFARNASRGMTIANTAFAVAGNPINAAIVPVTMNTTHGYTKDLQVAKREAAERTLNKFMGQSLSAERRASWSKAGLIDPSLAE